MRNQFTSLPLAVTTTSPSACINGARLGRPVDGRQAGNEFDALVKALVANTTAFYDHAQLPTLELQIVFLCKLLRKEIVVVVLFEYQVFARFSFVLVIHRLIWQ